MSARTQDEGSYQTIVADPPWQVGAGPYGGGYERGADGKQQPWAKPASNRSRPLAYPSMSVAQMCSLRVPAAKDAHLYLWTINRYLSQAFDVMDAWGFNYSTTLVWAKRPMGGGLGGCYGIATEFVLFGRRGSLPALSRVGRNWFDWKRPYDSRGKPRHSGKPGAFFEMVEQVSPGPRLEMFAREKRNGWHSWGNEVKNDVELVA